LRSTGHDRLARSVVRAFGIAPALRATSMNLTATLKEPADQSVAFIGVALAEAACVAAFWWSRRHEAALAAPVEQALPSPWPPPSLARF